MTQTILVAEDSVTMRTVVEMAFHGAPYAIVCLESGEQALTAAYEKNPAVILLDYSLPDHSGIEVCRAIKSDPNLRDIPVVLMGGKFHNFSEADARAAGCDAVILKPFKTDAIVEQVNQLAKGGASGARAAAPAGQSASMRRAQPAAPAPAPAPAPGGGRQPRFNTGAQSGSGARLPSPGPRGGSTSGSRPKFQPAAQAPVASSGSSRPRFAPGPRRPQPQGGPGGLGRHPAGGSGASRLPQARPGSGSSSSGGLRRPAPGNRMSPPAPAPTPQQGSAPRALSMDSPISGDDKTPVPAQLPSDPSATAAALAAAIDPEEINRLVREEVQRAVRDQMLAMVKTVLGDLFQERMMPRLLKYGEDRINTIVVSDLQVIMQSAVEAELAKLGQE